MQRFKNILVVYNNAVGDEATLSRATALAERNQARVTVAEIVAGSMVDEEIAQRQLHLERLATSVRQGGVEARATVLVGIPFLEIIREVLRGGHDLVVMTAERPFGIKDMLFGSTSMHLMRKCPCPVWVTNGPPKRYTGILAAVDPAADGQDPYNRTILELGSSLAKQEQSELHVVHAWDFSGDDIDMSRSEITQGMMDRLIRKNEEPPRKRLETLLAKFDLRTIPHQTHLIRGDPTRVIPELARIKKIELIVMGTVCRTGVPGLFIGNTAETVLRLVDCAVLTVKPRGFVTPVTMEA